MVTRHVAIVPAFGVALRLERRGATCNHPTSNHSNSASVPSRAHTPSTAIRAARWSSSSPRGRPKPAAAPLSSNFEIWIQTSRSS